MQILIDALNILADALRHHPEIALFLTLAFGFWLEPSSSARSASAWSQAP